MTNKYSVSYSPAARDDLFAIRINTLSSMNHRGSWLQANSLAMIADYLKVSVDYLLGRTDNSVIEQLEGRTIEDLTIIINGTEYQLMQADKLISP